MSDWIDAREWVPEHNGHYLILQKSQGERTRIYRVVKYWKNGEWTNAKEAEYGEVRYWMALPPIPEDFK